MTADAAASLALRDERRRSRRTVLTVVAAVAAAILCFVDFGLSADAFISTVFAVTLVVLTASDLERRIIPNRIVLPAAAFVLFAHVAIHPGRSVEWLLAAAGAYVGFLALALLQPAGLGMGDVKLALLLGAGLGWSVLPALLLGTLAAGLYGAVILLVRGRSQLKTTFPLGPFLAAAALVVLFLG